MRIGQALGAGLLTMTLAAAPAKAVDVTEVTSPGGTTFWLVEEQSIPIVSIQIAFKGGARLDPEDRPGLARMMGALLDEGAGDLDAVGFATAKDELAARFSVTVGRDKITVGAQMLAEDAAESAALLGTALTAPRFDAEAVERIRGQLLSELAQQETQPRDVAGKAWSARAFAGHPYAQPLDGTKESAAAITRDELAAAHGRLLTRANAVVAVVGAVDGAAAGALVDTILGGVPLGEALPPPPAAPTPEAGTEVIALPVPQSVAIFGHDAIGREHPLFYAAFVMNYVLGGGGFSSRLMEEVREKRGLAYGVYSYMSIRDGGAFYLGSVQTANARMAESLEVIRGEWARMAEEGISEEELANAKRYLTGSFALRFDSNAKIANFLILMQEEDLGIDYIDRRNAIIEAVTLEEVNEAAKLLLKPDALAITVVGEPAGL